jgi:trans-aconitate 2-methyltransferase
LSKWAPAAYLRFEKERTLPARDLAARIDFPHPRSIVDIGCGPGNSTSVLRDRWPEADILGVDNSPDMINKASQEYPSGTWVLADASEWRPDRTFDIVFSNAALQWIPNHEVLIPKLWGIASPDGALAVQIPANDQSPLHLALRSVAQREQWYAHFTGIGGEIAYHTERFYYDLLAPLWDRTQLWHTTYYHVMSSHQDLVDWYSSTGMKPYLAKLVTEQSRLSFRQQVLEEAAPHYPLLKDGRVLFPFRRLFILSYKRAEA